MCLSIKNRRMRLINALPARIKIIADPGELGVVTLSDREATSFECGPYLVLREIIIAAAKVSSDEIMA